MMCLLLVLSLLAGPAFANHGCITRDVFGAYRPPEQGGEEVPVYRYTLDNGVVSVQVMDYGATITTITVPDRKGQKADIHLGFDTLEGYFTSDNQYFGATLGRIANRIRDGKFTVDGVTYHLYRNTGKHSLHGGLRAFDKKLWSSRMEEGRVVMEYTSPEGEEGFPGEVTASASFSLTSDNTLVIEYRATATKHTPINLSNHAYFNLAGHDAGAAALNKHTVTIRADHITETDDQSIPTGTLLPVGGTGYDLRQPQVLGEALKHTPNDGFDDNYVLPQDRETVSVAVVEDPISGRRMEVFTSQPGLQFYTSNGITEVKAKAGAVYRRHAAFCLEAQNFPDAVNHPGVFPNSVYGPGNEYYQVIKYKFGLTSNCL